MYLIVICYLLFFICCLFRGVGEHTDYGVLTILKQDNSGGLQVKNRDNQWIDAPPINNSFVINIGKLQQKEKVEGEREREREGELD